MSKDIDVNVQDVGSSTPIASDVHVQLDNLPVPEIIYYEGVATIERFEAYVTGIYDIQQNNILTDVKNIDPKTGTNYQYRITSIPEPFPDGHMELTCDLLRGGV